MERIRTVYLARHGDIGLQGAKKYIGRTDLPLSPIGLSQANLLRETMAKIQLTAIYCSDLTRSIETAEIIAGEHQLKPVVSSTLREINMGAWEGQSFSEIARRYPEEYRQRGNFIATYQPPGGESFIRCQRRVTDFFEQIIESTRGDILIVGHAGVNRSLLSYLMGQPLSQIFTIPQDYGCLSEIALTPSGYDVNIVDANYKDIKKA